MPKYRIPTAVTEKIRAHWGMEPAERRHAAKQAICWLFKAGGIQERDQDAVVNYTLLAGYLAATCQGPLEFIEEFQEKVSKRWFGIS